VVNRRSEEGARVRVAFLLRRRLESFICVSSQPNRSSRYDYLSTCKAMAEASRDAISLAKVPSDEMADNCPDRRTVGRIKWLGVNLLESQNNQTVRRSFMFHYRVLGCLGGVFPAGGCCDLLQTVAICCRPSLTAEIVAKCSQPVAIWCKIQKSANSASRWALPISLVDEGANRYRWTRIHRRTAEKQDRSWSTCAPSFLSYPPPTRGRSPRPGTKLRPG